MDIHLKYHIISKIKRIGGNLRLVAKVLGFPSNRISKIYEDLFISDGLTIYPVLEVERLGLNKVAIWCGKSKIKYETAKKLMGPLASIFRGDIEENKFLLLFYSNKELYKIYKEKLEEVLEKTNSNCEIHYVDKYYRYVNEEACYDFSNKKWTCDEKHIYISRHSDSLIELHKQDVNLLVTIQSNPFSLFHLNPHFNHISIYFKGFIYTLGATNYIITTRGDYILSSPYALWSVELDDGSYISEYHVDKENLDKLTKELKDQDIIVAVKELSFAHGFSVPYEVFKYNKWEMPKLIVES